MYYGRKSFFPTIHPQKTENQLSVASIPQTTISHHPRLLAKLLRCYDGVVRFGNGRGMKSRLMGAFRGAAALM